MLVFALFCRPFERPLILRLLGDGFKSYLESKKKAKSSDEKMQQKAGGFVDQDLAATA